MYLVQNCHRLSVNSKRMLTKKPHSTMALPTTLLGACLVLAMQLSCTAGAGLAADPRIRTVVTASSTCDLEDTCNRSSPLHAHTPEHAVDDIRATYWRSERGVMAVDFKLDLGILHTITSVR